MDQEGLPRALNLLALSLLGGFILLLVFYLRLGSPVPVALGAAWAGLLIAVIAQRRARARLWGPAVAAVGLLTVGKTLVAFVLDPKDPVRLPAMLCYLAAYVVACYALVRILRRAGDWRTPAVLLDAAMLSVAVIVVFACLAYAHWTQHDIPTARRVVVLLYPILTSLLVIGLSLVWFSPAGRVPAVQIGVFSVASICAQHCVELVELGDLSMLDERWEMIWAFAPIGLGVACSRLSTGEEARLNDRPDHPGLTRTQITTLGVLLCVPPLVLAGYGLAGDPVPWPPIAIGELILGVLVAVRLYGLMDAVQNKQAAVEHLARSDALTGAANRRRWDFALADVLLDRQAGVHQRIWVAMVDLDHFKRFNDSRGHQAGDRLLQETVRLWAPLMGPGDLLARYGGEEFAVLLCGYDEPAARARVELMRSLVPMGQTCSAGLARWDGAMSPESIVRAADQALYQAKALGRDRTVVADRATAGG